MEDSAPASPGMPHVPDHDSMVTVSLSDIQSNSEHTQPDWRNLDIPPTPVESTHETENDRTKTESFGPMALRDAARTTPTPFDEPPTPTSSGDKPRDMTLDEEAENEVDWVNLEKTEEQEPRGEGSDEVSDWRSSPPSPVIRNGTDPNYLCSDSRRPCFSLAWNKRIMHWPQIPSLE